MLRLCGERWRPRQEAKMRNSPTSDLAKVHLPQYTRCNKHLERVEVAEARGMHLMVELATKGRWTTSFSLSFEQSCASWVQVGSSSARCVENLRQNIGCIKLRQGYNLLHVASTEEKQNTFPHLPPKAKGHCADCWHREVQQLPCPTTDIRMIQLNSYHMYLRVVVDGYPHRSGKQGHPSRHKMLNLAEIWLIHIWVHRL